MNKHHQSWGMISTIAVLVIGALVWQGCYLKPKQHPRTIGILQTASHPALDAAREGFIAACEQKWGKENVAFIVMNGQGSIAQLHSMATSLHANRAVKAIFAIATPAAQAAANVEKEKPIIIAAVTDPQSAGLEQSNVCGVPDAIDIEAEVDMLVQLLPKAHKVALLYSPGEVNSVSAVKKMQAALEVRGKDVVLAGITSEAELQAVVTMACHNADVLLAPTDNLVATTLPLIAQKVIAEKKPFMVSDNMLVAHPGVLAARGVTYYQTGYQAGECAVRLINDAEAYYHIEGDWSVQHASKKITPAEIGFVQAECAPSFNEGTAEMLGISMNDVLWAVKNTEEKTSKKE